MNKLSKLIKSLRAIIKQPSLLNIILESEEISKNEFLSSYPNYSNGLNYLQINQILSVDTDKIEQYSFSGGNSYLTDIWLLKNLCQQIDNCNYLEIGTWRGESVVQLADYCKECYTLNLSANQMKDMGLAESYINQHELFSKYHPGITHLKGDSRKFDFRPYYGKIDVVFVDGNHHYDYVLNDTIEAFKLLRDENSVIVWHDYTKNGETIRWDILKAILDGSTKENRKHIYQVKDSLSAIFTKRAIKSTPNTMWHIPEFRFDVQIEIKSISK